MLGNTTGEARRVQLEPAFVLHHRPFRDSSLLLDVVTLRHGRLALVARGARAGRSRLKGFLRPFLPLRLSWHLRGDLGTLTGAELDGRPVSLAGEALLSGYYVNELLLAFLHRHDPQPDVFNAYRRSVEALGACPGNPAALLREFELELLRLLGYGVVLDHEAVSGAALEPENRYEYRVEQGPVGVRKAEGDMVFRGDRLLAIGERRFEDPEVLRDAGRLLRTLVAHHLGGRELKSRKVLVDLRRGRGRMPGPAASGANGEIDA